MRLLLRRDFLFFSVMVMLISVLLYFTQIPQNQTSAVSSSVELMQTTETSLSNWSTFTSQEFEFAISYPADWKVVPSGDAYLPKFTLEPRKNNNRTKDTFTPQTQVVIYPRGYPEREFLGAVQPTQLTHQYQLRNSRDYILVDGSPWASEIQFGAVPSSWGPLGFIWLEANVDGYIEWCENLDKNTDCDPLFGDRLLRDGQVSLETRALLKEILATFTFIDVHKTLLGANNESTDIAVTEPKPNRRIYNPVRIAGTAPATWFFEGRLGVEVRDINGVRVGFGTVSATNQAGSEWSFGGSVEYVRPETSAGSVILQKANPQGIPNQDQAVSIPVVF